MKKNYFLMIAAILFCNILFGQNAIVGSGFSTGWNSTGDFNYLTPSTGSSYIGIINPNGTGDQYFRFGVDWDFGNTIKQLTITPGVDTSIALETINTLNNTSTSSGAMFINVANASDNYVFKTKDAGATPTGDFVVFRVQGDVRTVSAASLPTTTYPGQTNTIIATLDGSLSTGQGVYLRYSTDNFTTSTVIEMDESTSTTYTADIPSTTNTVSANVSYYIFTSGDGLTIGGADADFYTINLNNNGGTNYNYTVSSSFATVQNGNWSDTTTWLDGTIPETAENVIINHNVTLDQNDEVNNLDINSGSLSINSGNSLIVNGTSTGNVTYNRVLGSTNWYLMGAPVNGVAINNDFVANNNIDDTTSTNNNIGVAVYVANDWTYFPTGVNASWDIGLGLAIKQDVASTMSFTGTINTSDVTASISQTGFTILANPYTSYMNSASLLTANTANLSSETIWLWNQATGNYETKITTDNFILTPTQGFFVNQSNTTNFTFAESNQQANSDTFQKTEPRTELHLLMTDGAKERFAKLYYIDGTTTGFDNGYDGETFNGVPNELDVFTHLISNSEGKKYQVQSLPKSDMESMVIPVGIIADANKEITFSANVANLPSGLKVFLEDRTTNTFTRLDELNSTYKVTLNEKTNDIGRFYLHTKSAALSTENVALENVSIYSADKATLRIVGLSQGKSTIKMFNVLGKQVLNSTFNSNGVSEINVSQLSTGVYIVQLANEAGTLNKKIVLE